VVRLRNKVLAGAWFDLPVTAAEAVATNDEAALFGMHPRRESPSRLWAVSLLTSQAGAVYPVDDHGAVVEFSRCFGRGRTLYLETIDAVYRVELG